MLVTRIGSPQQLCQCYADRSFQPPIDPMYWIVIVRENHGNLWNLRASDSILLLQEIVLGFRSISTAASRMLVPRMTGYFVDVLMSWHLHLLWSMLGPAFSTTKWSPCKRGGIPCSNICIQGCPWPMLAPQWPHSWQCCRKWCLAATAFPAKYAREQVGSSGQRNISKIHPNEKKKPVSSPIERTSFVRIPKSYKSTGARHTHTYTYT